MEWFQRFRDKGVSAIRLFQMSKELGLGMGISSRAISGLLWQEAALGRKGWAITKIETGPKSRKMSCLWSLRFAPVVRERERPSFETDIFNHSRIKLWGYIDSNWDIKYSKFRFEVDDSPSKWDRDNHDHSVKRLERRYSIYSQRKANIINNMLVCMFSRGMVFARSDDGGAVSVVKYIKPSRWNREDGYTSIYMGVCVDGLPMWCVWDSDNQVIRTFMPLNDEPRHREYREIILRNHKKSLSNFS